MAMLNDPAPEPRARLPNHFTVFGALFLVVGIYLGWVFLSRWEEDRALEEKAAAQRRAQARQTYEMMGGNRFDILGFYADPGRIRAGDTAELCYSVSNTKSVKLEPQSQAVWPAFSHCVQVSPRKTTRYTLTAEDAAGHTKSRSVEVEVH